MKLLLGLSLLAGMASLPVKAGAFQFAWDFRFSNRFQLEQNYIQKELLLDETSGRFDTQNYMKPKLDHLVYSFYIGASMDFKFSSTVTANVKLESGLYRLGHRNKPFTPPGSSEPLSSVYTTSEELKLLANGNAPVDELRDHLLVRELGFSFHTTSYWVDLTLGKKRFFVGDSFIFDGYGLGAIWTLDLLQHKSKIPFRIELQALLADGSFTSKGKKSPLVKISFEYVFSLVEAIGIYFAYYHDGDDNIAAIMRPAIAESYASEYTSDQVKLRLALAAPFESRGNLYYIGLNWNKFFGRLLLNGSLIVELGNYDLSVDLTSVPNVNREVKLGLKALAFLADCMVTYNFSEAMALTGYFLYISGDDLTQVPLRDLSNKPFSSFISVLPHITRSNIFFSGGMNESFSARYLTSSGQNARGVIGTGLKLDWDIIKRLNLKSNLAVLFSSSPRISGLAPGGSRFYGVELDFNFQFQLLKWLDLSAQFDFFITGPFYEARKLVYQMLLGVDMMF